MWLSLMFSGRNKNARSNWLLALVQPPWCERRMKKTDEKKVLVGSCGTCRSKFFWHRHLWPAASARMRDVAIHSLIAKLNWNSSFFVFHSKSSKASCLLSFFFFQSFWCYSWSLKTMCDACQQTVTFVPTTDMGTKTESYTHPQTHEHTGRIAKKKQNK